MQSRKSSKKRRLDEPAQSDATLLLNVEDLIHMAMGPTNKNVVNFKLIESVLFILARQMRVLETQVELRLGELDSDDERKHDRTTSFDLPDEEDDKGEDRVSKGVAKGQEDEDETSDTSDKETKGDKGDDEAGRRKGRKGGKSGKGSSGKDDDDEVEMTAGKGGKGGKSGKRASGKDGDDEVSMTAGKRGKGGKSSKGSSGNDDDDEVEKTAGKRGKGGKSSKGSSGNDDDDEVEMTAGKRGKGGKGSKGSSGKYSDDVDVGGKEGGKGAKEANAGDDDQEGGTQGQSGASKGRGPFSVGSSQALAPRRVGSIEVVTQKQFEVLEGVVKMLLDKVSLPPPPTMPDNKKLRSDIAKGNASLTDTMQAMQLSARVMAAETAIGNMADLITQLAASGVIPDDIASKVAEIQGDMQAIRKGMIPGRGGVGTIGAGGVFSAASGHKPTTAGSSALSRPSATSRAGATSGFDGVTKEDMEDGMQKMREEIMRAVHMLTSRATKTAEAAALNVKNITDKMDKAMKLDGRVTELQSLVDDYAQQLSGFDSGLTTQMTGFQEQMLQIRSDLSSGLAQLEQVNNNAETAAVMDLTERYEALVVELDSTLQAHRSLTIYQRQLADELKSLVEAVEMMREQKADREEVLDGLRDKADASRLKGLLTDAQFSEARDELEVRIQMCYEKFRKQDAVWMNVVNDFNKVTQSKAELTQLMGAREEAQEQLQDLNAKVQRLARLLGDPKAAMVTRQLSRGAVCAVCNVPALIDPVEPKEPPALPYAHAAGAPPPSDSEDDDEPCLRGVLLNQLEDKEPQPEPHMCLRWVGGSHTMIGAGAGRGSASRERAHAIMASMTPVRRYVDYGSDGKLYKLQEDILPCEECNQLAPEPPAEGAGKRAGENIPGAAQPASGRDGGGDPGGEPRRVTVVDPSSARHVTVLDQKELDNIADAHTPSSIGSKSRRQTEDYDAGRPMAGARSAMSRTYADPEESRTTKYAVGTGVQGRVTVLDKDALQMAVVRQEIQEDHAKVAASKMTVEEKK